MDDIRQRLTMDGVQVIDLHVWRSGPGHHAAIIVLQAEAPEPALAYRRRLEGIPELSHITIEVRANSDSRRAAPDQDLREGMSRQTLSSMPAAPPARKSLVRKARRAAAGLFWKLADGGWVLVVAGSKGLVRVKLWVATSPARLLRTLKGLPDTAIDMAIGGALKTFELRWPLVTMASLAGATAIAGQLPSPERAEELKAPRPVRLMPTLLAVKDAPAQVPKPGPEALQRDLDLLAETFGETVGLAIVDISANWMVDVRGDKAFPQQSVSKLWVALTTLSAIDRGVARLDDQIVLTEADRSVFNQPISYLITPEGFPTTVEDLLRRALIDSDNAANDKLMALAGGPGAVRRLLHEKGLEGISLAEDERHLQAHIAGLTWSSDLAPMAPSTPPGRACRRKRARRPSRPICPDPMTARAPGPWLSPWAAFRPASCYRRSPPDGCSTPWPGRRPARTA